MTRSAPPRVVVTVGEPAGIGPDVVLTALTESHAGAITVLGDSKVLRQRAAMLGLDVEIQAVDPASSPAPHRAGLIPVVDIPVSRDVRAGRPDPENARAVVRGIDTAVDLCQDGRADAMVTAPVHKAVINDAGISFQGHTEWIAERTGGDMPVMMLAGPGLRVCLATTHLPLAEVPMAITRDHLTRVLEIVDRDIGRLYGLDRPVIGVLGLNPHAGEGGHMGTEEIDTIVPAMRSLESGGMRLVGPLPADTAFTPSVLGRLDAVLAMYHDQGLPVVKYRDFGEVVNVTLGLPLIRTSVDHGTALDLAGSGRGSASSLIAAIHLAMEFSGGNPSRDT